MSHRLFVAAGLALSSTLAPAAGAQAPLPVTVTYWQRPCGMPGALAMPVSVTAGTLQLRDGSGATASVALGPGPTPALVPAALSGPLTATLVLETPRIRIVSGASAVTPVTLNLAPAAQPAGTLTFSMSPREDDSNGSIHALMHLERAADFAEQAHGSRLPQLTARIFDVPGTHPSGVTHFDSPSSLNIAGVSGSDDRWEPVPLIHEYGHFVMEQLVPGGPSGGEHLTEKSYPERPDLAWTEGFASAFAGLVTDPESSGLMFYRCGPYMSFAETPARPRLAVQDARYAQYNETRVAAATYHLVHHLGRGVPGFTRLLDGLKRYSRDGHGVWTARDLRDLAVREFETSSADHAAIDDIFTAQGMSWNQHFILGISDESGREARAAEIEIVVSVTGPGGFDCRPTKDIDSRASGMLDNGRDVVLGEKVADGGLAYSANDDCYLVSGDGVVAKGGQRHTLGADGIEIPFPYLGALAHWAGSYTVRAKYVCEFDRALGTRSQFRCPPTFTAMLSANNPWLFINAPALLGEFPVTLVKDVDMEIVTFKANGECTMIGGIDCGF